MENLAATGEPCEARSLNSAEDSDAVGENMTEEDHGPRVWLEFTVKPKCEDSPPRFLGKHMLASCSTDKTPHARRTSRVPTFRQASPGDAHTAVVFVA